jgi:uncharacterized membrane protein
MNHDLNSKPLVIAGTFLGIGLGGFFDGILFHQLLGIHNMLTAKFPKMSIANIEINMFWDGLFHSFTYMMTVTGLALLWRAGARRDVPWSGKTFAGALFLGWGLFNLVEGVIDHHILNIHHVIERYGQSAYDYAFLASGIILILGGVMAIRSARRMSHNHGAVLPRGDAATRLFSCGSYTRKTFYRGFHQTRAVKVLCQATLPNCRCCAGARRAGRCSLGFNWFFRTSYWTW